MLRVVRCVLCAACLRADQQHLRPFELSARSAPVQHRRRRCGA
jgi:hypothetical protein